MRFKIGFFLCVSVLFVNSLAYADSYSEVLFGSSVMPGNYGYSQVSYSGFSWVENVKGHVPLIDSIVFTPGNSISLKYTSSVRGHWEVTVFYPERRSYSLMREDEMLSFRIYLMDDMDRHTLPSVALLQGDTCSHKISMLPYVTDSLHSRQWLHVLIPLDEIKGLQSEKRISGITFYQEGPTGVEAVNHMLIDQIEFTMAEPPGTELSYPAVLDRAEAFERHVMLEWQLPLDPGIRYAQIYRSEDNEFFRPVAIRPILASNYVDVVPATNRTYYYKVSWLDHHYQESPFSSVLRATTAPMSDDRLMDVIQAAHINFFIKRTEFNSGMHAVSFTDRNAVVSVEETGYSLLVYTVGASRDLIANRAYIRRLNAVVDFLCDRAEQYQGVYPAYLDGRSGKGIYREKTDGVSIRATSSLMQGLLVSRNYLKNLLATRQDNRQDRALRERIQSTVNRIDQLWQGVQWNGFAREEGAVLYDNWSPNSGFRYARPMGGFGADLLSYLLALSSPHYALSPEAYVTGLGIRRTLVPADHQDLKTDHIAPLIVEDAAVKIQGSIPMGMAELYEDMPADTLWQQYVFKEEPYSLDTLMYGFYLDIGRLDQSLLEAYAPFLAFDPRLKKDRYANYEASLSRLIQAYKRRDNEIDAGNMTSDIWGTAERDPNASGSPVLVPAISIGSYAFTPQVAQRAMRSLYSGYGALLFTEYGFRDWISIHDHQIAEKYRGLNQAAIPVLIENGRTGLIWNLFMQHEDIDRTVSLYFQEDL